jgi:hypothetical protein
MSNDRWVLRLRALLGAAVVGWELAVDRLHHWPPTLILAFWLLGGPIEELVRFFTGGRIQINVRPDDETEKGKGGGEQ